MKPGPNSHYAEADDAELEALQAALPAKTEEDYNLEHRRKTRGMLFRAPQSLAPGVKSTNVQIPVEGGEILVRIYTPEKAVSNAPLLVWYHGGGFVMGHPNMDDLQSSLIVATHGMVVISVDYRLAPEFPFPIPVNDSFAALKWAVANASQYGVSIEKGLLVGGTSAGGNIAAVMTILARDDDTFKAKITGQLLIIPVTCWNSCYPEEYKTELTSYAESEHFPYLNQRLADCAIKDYKVADPTDIRFSPLLAPLKGLPKAVIQVHGRDPLRDDGIVYSKALQANGVATKLYVYPGAMHGFFMAFPKTKTGIRHANDLQEGVKWLLQDTDA